jgi:hypothetical protein
MIPGSGQAACTSKIDLDARSCVVPLPPAMSCEPAPRFMHLMVAGKLLGGKDAAVVYGGVSSTGQLLQDIWLYPLHETFPTTKACENCGWLVRTVLFVKIEDIVCQLQGIKDLKMVLSKMATGDHKNRGDVHFEIVEGKVDEQICEYTCSDDSAFWALSTKKAEDPNPAAGAVGAPATPSASIQVSVTLQLSIGSSNPNENYYYDMMGRCAAEGGCKELFDKELASLYLTDKKQLLVGTKLMRFETMQKEELLKCYRRATALSGNAQTNFRQTCLQYREARVDAHDLDFNPECTENCARGYCQFQDINRYDQRCVPPP